MQLHELLRQIDFPIPDLGGVNVFPLVYALLLSGAIGLEREWSGRPAGLRTHVLVCLSSTMLVMISQHLGAEVRLVEGTVVFDPNRMAAGIVTGIGFLGAATVLRSGDLLRGLTTAACIWFVAALGIVLGNQNYALGVLTTMTVLLVLTMLNRLTDLIHPVIYRRLIVLHSRSDAQAAADSITALLKSHRCRVIDLASGHDGVNNHHELVFYVAVKNSLQSPKVTATVAALEGVVSARWKLISNPH